MSLESTFDIVPVWIVLGTSVLLMIGSIDLGFHWGMGHGQKPVKEQLSQVRSIMGASLGLLAFMLAFSFNIAQSHFEKRNEAFVLEINAITSAYLSSGLLPPEAEATSRSLLQDLVGERIAIQAAAGAGRMDEVAEGIQRSEDLLQGLWRTAEAQEYGVDSGSSGMFTQAVLTMIGVNELRIHAALYNRIPPVNWIVLVFVAALSMLVMGYHAGLTGTRSRVATWSLALIFSAVLMLVTDLDRPRMSLFTVNQEQMLDLQRFMTDR